MDKSKIWSHFGGLNRREREGRGKERRRGREEEEEEGRGEEEDKKGMFSTWDQVYFDFLRLWFGEMFLLCLGFCGKITQTLELLRVRWVKP